MHELEEQRLQAEIRQLEADTAKLEAQRKELRSWGHWLTEAFKVFTALILGAGGLAAGITGYHLAERKTQEKHTELRRIEDELKSKEVQFREVEDKRKTAESELAAARKNIADEEKQLQGLKSQTKKFKADLGAVQRQLANAKKIRPKENKPAIDAAINQTTKIERDVDNAEVQLQEMIKRFRQWDTGL